MGVARPDLQFIALQPPPAGCAIEVAPGVRWAKFSLPFRLNHINVWMIEDRGGLTVVDSGIADEGTRAQWETIASQLGSSGSVARVISTHHHPDHCGLIDWMSRRLDAPVAMSRTEWLLGQYYLHENEPALCEANDRFYRRTGYPAGFFANQNVPFKSLIDNFPSEYQRLFNGKTTAVGGDWTVMTFGGHAPEHVCLHNASQKILIAGDQMLPTISPIVGVAPYEPDENPLNEFLQSLELLRQLPPDTLVLPSHGQPFTALHTRIDALVAHHERRLTQLNDALSVPANSATLTSILFPKVAPGFDLIFALTETIAHARCLQARGRIGRYFDASGIEMFERV